MVNEPQRQPAEPRSVKKALADMGVGTLATVSVLAFAFLVFYGRHGFTSAAEVGHTLAGQFGWMLSVYVPVQLGFYAVVLGGQIKEASSETRIRRNLGLVAEAITVVATVPAVLIAVYCVMTPGAWGLLIAVLPAMGLQWFLAAQLGAFVVFDDRERIAGAQRTIDWATARAARVGMHESRNVVLIMVAWAIAIAFAACIAFAAAVSLDAGYLAELGGLSAPLAIGFMLLNFSCMRFTMTGDSPVTAVTVAGMTVLVYLFFAGTLSTSLWSNTASASTKHTAVIFLAVIAATIVVSYWPRRWTRGAIALWMLRAAAARNVYRSIELRRRIAEGDLAALQPSEPPRREFRARVSAAMAAFQGGSDRA